MLSGEGPRDVSQLNAIATALSDKTKSPWWMIGRTSFAYH
jgi:hypothetical protein